jgi:hypothetical protein
MPMCAPERTSIRGGLPKPTGTRRPRLVSQKRKRHRQRPHPLPTKLAPATIKGARQPRSLRATKGCLQCCRRITCGRSGARGDTCGPAADSTDDLRLAAGCRPSGGAVDGPPHDLGRDFPHVSLRLPRLYGRGLAPASVEAAAPGVYVVTTCPSPQHRSLHVSINGICHRE